MEPKLDMLKIRATSNYRQGLIDGFDSQPLLKISDPLMKTAYENGFNRGQIFLMNGVRSIPKKELFLSTSLWNLIILEKENNPYVQKTVLKKRKDGILNRNK